MDDCFQNCLYCNLQCQRGLYFCYLFYYFFEATMKDSFKVSYQRLLLMNIHLFNVTALLLERVVYTGMSQTFIFIHAEELSQTQVTCSCLTVKEAHFPP